MTFSRRTMLKGAAVMAAGMRSNKVPAQIDHLLFGCSDLDHGIALVEEHLGVRAAYGGVHPGRGSRNALLSLGERRYLEIIAPDPSQPRSADSRGLYAIEKPRLIGWAVHTGDIAALRLSVPTGAVMDGSRKRASGQLLQWKALSLKDDRGGLLPFFIEWSKESPHPSIDAPAGCTLEEFAIHSPDALPDLGLDVDVQRDAPPRLSALLKGPRGELRL